jgi:hypothetical protein
MMTGILVFAASFALISVALTLGAFIAVLRDDEDDLPRS